MSYGQDDASKNIYYMVDKKILKIHSETFFVSSESYRSRDE